MAYAALVSLQQTIHIILNCSDKHYISVGAREIITSIREYVIFLISFLDDFPHKPSRLEGKIRDLSHEAEDFIEFFMWKQFRISSCSAELSTVELEEQLSRVREKIGSITGDMMDDRPAAVSSSKVAATVKIDVVVGLDDDLLEIKGRLCGESSKLEVVSIVGMGGIGKTTLAQKAYDDPLITEYFDVRISHNYTVDEVLSHLGPLVSREMLQKDDVPMKEKVYKSLKGRRYLVVNVLDDVRNVFPDDRNGS